METAVGGDGTPEEGEDLAVAMILVDAGTAQFEGLMAHGLVGGEFELLLAVIAKVRGCYRA